LFGAPRSSVVARIHSRRVLLAAFPCRCEACENGWSDLCEVRS
jgi:hypothetical protein